MADVKILKSTFEFCYHLINEIKKNAYTSSEDDAIVKGDSEIIRSNGDNSYATDEMIILHHGYRTDII